MFGNGGAGRKPDRTIAAIAIAAAAPHMIMTARDAPPPDVPHEHPEGPVIALAPARLSWGGHP